MKRIISILMIIACLVSVVGCSDSDGGEKKEENKKVANATSGYDVKIFDNSYVHTIDVQIDQSDWEDLCANPTNKTKYQVNAVIDGELIENISFATKGNTSLSSVAADANSNRYSFKLNFGKFVEGQTYYGLDKLNLNNMYADATYMKDYISYEIFEQAGVMAPLTSYVYVYINGKEHGLYIAIEEIGESYLVRNESEGELYKPETEMLANMGDMPQMPNMPQGGDMPQMPNMPQGGEMPPMPNMPQGGDMPPMPNMPGKGENTGFDDSSKGAALMYSDDEIESYSDIFNNAETDVTEEDMKNVIAALKGLSLEEDLERYIDTDAVIRYFVAHNFVLNFDGYTGTMLHNYYLIEENGVLSMLPWDYNLAFGTFADTGVNGENYTGVINFGIDSPLLETTSEKRPMWNWIENNEEYLEKYHQTYDELIKGYFESGDFEKEMARVYEMIRPYVEKDASAFYSVDEFDVAYETLKSFCLLRSESIRLQVEGNLATVTTEQRREDMVDASSIDINKMGSQNRKVR